MKLTWEDTRQNALKRRLLSANTPLETFVMEITSAVATAQTRLEQIALYGLDAKGSMLYHLTVTTRLCIEAADCAGIDLCEGQNDEELTREDAYRVCRELYRRGITETNLNAVLGFVVQALAQTGLTKSRLYKRLVNCIKAEA